MVVAVDLVNITPTTVTSPDVTASLSVTVGSGPNRALVVQLITWGGTISGLSLTWDSVGANQAMTLIGSSTDQFNDSQNFLYGLVAPASGTKTLTASWTTPSVAILAAASFTGVSQAGDTTSFAHFNGTTGTDASVASGTVTSAVGNYTVAGFGYGGILGFTSLNQSQWFEESNLSFTSIGGYATGASTVTYSTVGSSGNVYAFVAVDIVASSGNIQTGSVSETGSASDTPNFAASTFKGATPETGSAGDTANFLGAPIITFPVVNQKPFRWTRATGLQAILPFLGENDGEVTATSSDGTTVVGFSNSAAFPNTFDAWQWTNGATTNLGIPTGGISSFAWCCSSDGTVIGGSILQSGGIYHAMRWTSALGAVDLGIVSGAASSIVQNMSANGNVLAGNDSSNTHAFYFIVGGSMAPVPLPPGAASITVNDLSADGTTVAGSYLQGGVTFAYSCVLGNPVTTIAFLPGGTNSVATAISSDGHVVVGTCIVAGVQHAFRWNHFGSLTDLGVGTASSISPDGRVVGGSNASGAVIWKPTTKTYEAITAASSVAGSLGKLFSGTQFPFIWTQANGFRSIALAPGQSGQAEAVASDGSVVVGTFNTGSPASNRAFRWTSAGGVTNLGVIGAATASQGLVASGDGNTIGGSLTVGTNFHAMKWTSAGMTDLGVVSGATSSLVQFMSSNGTVIAGNDQNGINPFYSVGGALIALPILSGATSSSILDLSLDGTTIVGSTVIGSVNHAFVYPIGKLIFDLGVLPGGSNAQAISVSNNGANVTGTSTVSGVSHGFVWSAQAGMLDLGAANISVISGSGRVIGGANSSGAAIFKETTEIFASINATSVVTIGTSGHTGGLAIAESIATISNLTGSLGRKHISLSETIASASAISATLAGVRKSTLSISSASTIVEILHRSRPIAEAVASASTSGGALTRIRGLIEHITATSLLTEVLKSGLGAQISSASVFSGSLFRLHPMASEAITSPSNVAERLTRSRPLAEAISAGSLLSAFQAKAGTEAENIASTSSVASALSRSRALVENLVAVSAVLGSFAPFHREIESIVSVSAVAGVLTRSHPAIANITSSSLVAESLARNRSITESISSSSVLTADVEFAGFLFETISSTSSVAISVQKQGHEFENIQTNSAVNASLSRSRQLSEVILPMSLVEDSLTGVHNLVMQIVVTTSVTDEFNVRYRQISESINATSSVDPDILNLPLPWNFVYENIIRVPKQNRTIYVYPTGYASP